MISSLPRIKKPKSYLELGKVEIEPIVERLGQLSDAAWAAEDRRKENKFECFHHTQHIILRFPKQNRDPRNHYTNPGWYIWQDLLLPIMEQLASQYDYENVVISKAMFARLKAGHKIDKHVDGADANLCTHKIHVPLITNPDAHFITNGETRHLEAANAYEVNNIAEHAANNLGSEDRVHFIFEIFDAAASVRNN